MYIYIQLKSIVECKFELSIFLGNCIKFNIDRQGYLAYVDQPQVAVFVLSIYVSPQIHFECKFEIKYLAGKIDINRQDYPALVSGGRFRVVCLRESSNPL